MPHPFLIFSQSDYLIQVVDINSHTLMANSADPDQLASEEANWSGSTLFAKTGHVVFSKRRVNTKFKALLMYKTDQSQPICKSHVKLMKEGCYCDIIRLLVMFMYQVKCTVGNSICCLSKVNAKSSDRKKIMGHKLMCVNNNKCREGH